MAVFGAPLDREDDAERAVRAALSIRRKLEHLMTDLKEELRYKVRIGINTGRVVAGNIGSEAIMSYTVIGDAVNLGAGKIQTVLQACGFQFCVTDHNRYC